MSIDRFYVREIEVLRADDATDRYGSTGHDWSSPRIDWMQGWVSQTSATEPQSDGRDPLDTSLILYLPIGAQIGGRDRVRLDRTVYEIEGQPHEAWTPNGPHHLEVTLREVAG